MSGATLDSTPIPEGGSAITPYGTSITCNIKGGCIYNSSGARMMAKDDTYTPSAGPPSWIWWLLPVGGLSALGVGIYMSMPNPSTRNGSNEPAAAPMPPTIEQGGRRVSRARRKHHSKNKTRRA